MKKVLIITYYWPPSGGSGVQRWLKFCKYLPEFGYEPIVLTPENPSFINKDPDLLKDVPESMEVLKLPIWEPYQFVAKLTGKELHQKNVNVGAKQSFFQKVTLWLRGNILIPDPRKYWINPVYKFLKDYLPQSGIDTIITTGPPHSMHVIGLKLKRKLNVKWIADFRDPWTEWDIMDSFHLSSYAKYKHRKLEKAVLKEADRVMTVGWTMNEDIKRLGAPNPSVITNGFDHADFNTTAEGLPKNPEKQTLIIRHIGSIDEMRNPRPFLDALGQLIEENETLGATIKVEFIGNVNPVFKTDVQNNSLWNSFTSFIEYKSHKEILQLYRETDVLLLVLAHSHSARLNVTGKIFEYMASGVPVFGIGDPEGDAARILHESGVGTVTSYEEKGLIKDRLLKLIQYPGAGKIDLENSEFNRRNLTGKLAKILNEL